MRTTLFRNVKHVGALLLLNLFVGYLYGQPNNNLATSYPTNSENVSGQDIYNVDLYSGKLNLSVPIYSFSGSSTDLKIAVSLDYDGGGNKVNTVASQVGLNWELDYGGILKREINGLPDELPSIGYRHTGAVPTAPNFPPGTTPPLNTIIEIAKDELDSELDVFSYKVGRFSGKFYIGKNSTIRMEPENNVKVTVLAASNAPLTGGSDSVRSNTFIITTPEGLNYHFNLYNCEKINYYNANFKAKPPVYASTEWYLTKINHPFTNKEVNLEYTIDETSVFVVPKVQDISYEYVGSSMRFCGKCNDAFCNNPASEFENHFRRNFIISKLIIPNGDIIEFLYENYRPDQNDKSLDKIKISNIYSSNVKTYILSHIVTNRQAGGIAENVYLEKGTQAYNNLAVDVGMNYYKQANQYSILLNKVYQLDEPTNTTLPGYEFIYHPTTLPLIGANKGVDLWGFYCKYGNLSNTNQEVLIYDFENRSPVLGFCNAKSLQKIALPSGASLSFEYELNAYKEKQNYPQHLSYSNPKASGLRVKTISRKDELLNSPSQIIKSYKYINEDGTTSGVLPSIPQTTFSYSEGYYTQNFYSTPVKNCEDFDYTASSYGWVQFPFNIDQVYNFLGISRSPLNKQRTAHGGIIEYERVEEYDGSFTNFLNKRVYSFTTIKDYGGAEENSVPFTPLPDFSFKRGLLKEIQSYNKANVLLKKVVNEYHIKENSLAGANFNSLKVAVIKSGLASSSISDFSMGNYFPITGTSLLKKSTITTYFNNDQYTEDIVNYTYDNNYNLLTKVALKNEREENIEQRIYYPFNYNIPGPVNQLTSLGIFSNPLVVENWNIDKNLLISSMTNTPKHIGFLGSNNIRPDKAYVLTSKEPITAQIWGTFDATQLLKQPQHHTEFKQNVAYDGAGNVIEEKAKGVTKSYIYGNNNSQLIAEVYNAEASDIAYTSFENAQSQGGWTWGGPAGIQQNFKLTGNSSFVAVNLPGGMIDKSGLNSSKTYIVSFWGKGALPPTIVKNGSATIIPEILETYQGWTLYKCRLEGATSIRITVRPGNYLDELRLYPENAMMTTKCYEALWNAPITECSADNRFISYEYDQFGRPKLKRDMDGNILNMVEYAPQETQN